MARRRPQTGRTGRPAGRARSNRTKGFSTLEILFAAATLLTIGGVATPPLRHAMESFRASGAARYVATKLQRVRMDAIRRSTDVAIRFVGGSTGYSFAVYVDGNRNGVLSYDIQDGVDWLLGPPERLRDNFSGVDFGTLPGLPPIDAGGTPPGTNPIRLGASGYASFSALGTSSTGTLYVKGTGNHQFAIRIYGETAKTRILKYDVRTQRWNPL